VIRGISPKALVIILIIIASIGIVALGVIITKPQLGSDGVTLPHIELNLLRWFILLSIATAPIAALLLAINHFNKPVMFAKMPILVFGSLTAYVICFTMAVSDLPDQLFPDQHSPISTRQDVNKTQWVLNVGGIFENNNNNPQGLQIPMYIIIAGILGAYIRYLYLGIPEFKTAIQKKLTEFKESERSMYYAAEEYLTQFNEELQEGKYESNKSSKQVIEESPESKEARKKLAKLSSGRSITNLFFGQGALLFTDIPPPRRRRKKKTNSFTSEAAELARGELESPFPKKDEQDKKRLDTTKDSWDEWEKVLHRIADFEKNRFALSFEATSYILKTVGSFHLAPLLAVLAWLLLSVGGANDYRTFALVSFAIGLTTKTIIKRVMSFVGDQFKEDDEQDIAAKREETTSISTDPPQVKTGQTLAVTGKGFAPDASVSLYFGDNGADKSIIVNSIPTSASGTFVHAISLQGISPKTYTLKAKDSDGKFASTPLLITDQK